MKRDKSKFEKWFSFSRHKRRIGSKFLSEQLSKDFNSLKKKIVPGNDVVYTHGSDNKIEEHFMALKQEFAGKSELCYTHAKIIVLIRRGSDIKKNFELFQRLWREEKKFLLKNLNTRWLIAATDTFSDHTDDDVVKSLSIARVCLLNTVKLQESERFITNAQQCQDDINKINRLNNDERFSLFDGTSVFKFGTDDTLRNMRWRIDKVSKLNVAGEILLEIFLRLQEFDTVFKRARDRHIRNKTSWW